MVYSPASETIFVTREFIQGLLKTSTGKCKPENILATEAFDLLAIKLCKPLQAQPP